VAETTIAADVERPYAAPFWSGHVNGDAAAVRRKARAMMLCRSASATRMSGSIGEHERLWFHGEICDRPVRATANCATPNVEEHAIGDRDEGR
jgi:hypothetical protein